MSSEIKKNSIIKLDAELINKIAAGEVVERPASVIKELVENALDAESASIVVEIEQGGKKLIRVSDDGVGMSPEDAQMSLERHTTSKIESFDDLYNLKTLGFRGEALASIAAVSNFSIQTKTTESVAATTVFVAKHETTMSASARDRGTTVSVADLFHNVPARQKFLKTDSTEYQHILHLITQYALLEYGVSWKLISNKQTIFHFPATGHWRDRVEQVLGTDNTGDLYDINTTGSISLRGFIGSAKSVRQSNKWQFIYVNGRLINDHMISRAVKDAYGDLIAPGQYPTFVLEIKLPANLVDVNVHPRKTEVKFENQQEVFKLIRSVVKNTLYQHDDIRSVDLMKTSARSHDSYTPVDKSGFVFKPIAPAAGPWKTDHLKQALQFTETIARTAVSRNEVISDDDGWKLIGQIHKSYLIVETPKGFLVIDQHAAAERINYDRLLNELHSRNVGSQHLLVPVTVELTHREAAILDDARPMLSKIGFNFDTVGHQTVTIRAVPHDLIKSSPEELFKGIIDDMDEEGFDHLHNLEKKQEVVVKYAACRGAIMFNDLLTTEEQISLLKQIKEIPPDRQTCCHGRPFMKEFNKEDLEKLFHRR